jgi:hypothetical protein
MRWLNRQFTVKEFALRIVSRDHSRRYQEFLPGCAFLGQQYREDVVVTPR